MPEYAGESRMSGQKITLYKDVRLLVGVKPKDILLVASGKWLRKGGEIHVSGMLTKTFNHCVTEVRQVFGADVAYYVIEAELWEDPPYLRPPTSPDVYVSLRAVQ